MAAADPAVIHCPPFDGTRASLRAVLAADLAMQGLDRWRARYRVTRGVVHFERLLRRAEYWTHPSRRGPLAAPAAVVAKLRLRRQSERLGFDVPRGVFGPGLSIAHSGMLVVHGHVRVGARCRIHQGVTIGAGKGGVPTVGDDVFIGPNAVLLGGITVGDGAFVYPGAVCTVDVPPGFAAAGVPATVRPYGGEPWRSGDLDPI